MKRKATYIQIDPIKHFFVKELSMLLYNDFFLLTDSLEFGHFQISTQEAINQHLKIVFNYIFKIAFQRMS